MDYQKKIPNINARVKQGWWTFIILPRYSFSAQFHYGSGNSFVNSERQYLIIWPLQMLLLNDSHPIVLLWCIVFRRSISVSISQPLEPHWGHNQPSYTLCNHDQRWAVCKILLALCVCMFLCVCASRVHMLLIFLCDSVGYNYHNNWNT